MVPVELKVLLLNNDQYNRLVLLLHMQKEAMLDRFPKLQADIMRIYKPKFYPKYKGFPLKCFKEFRRAGNPRAISNYNNEYLNKIIDPSTQKDVMTVVDAVASEEDKRKIQIVIGSATLLMFAGAGGLYLKNTEGGQFLLKQVKKLYHESGFSSKGWLGLGDKNEINNIEQWEKRYESMSKTRRYLRDM